MKIIERTFDAITGETTEVERQMSQSELKQWQADKAKIEIEQAEAESKATAKAALLEKLGITADEAALLLS